MKKPSVKVVVCLVLSLFALPTSPVYPTPPDHRMADETGLEVIRKRILADLLEPAVNSQKISALIKTIRPDGSWPGINYQDVSKTGFQHSVHLENMLDLARAGHKPGSEFYGNPAVKKTLSAALDFWNTHDFRCENWWWNEMGTPNWMINTLLLADADLTDKQRADGIAIASRASFSGFGARAGGDFVPIAGMVCKQALFKRDEALLQNAIQVMAAQIVVTPDRGIKPDLSFHHRVDNVTSIHTYGTNYVSSFAYWAVRTAGTRFQLPEPALKLLIDYYLDGVCKSMAYGMYSDPGARNRDLSRKGDLEPAGTDIPENLLKASSYRQKELEDLILIRTGRKKSETTWNRYYWWSSYAAHQRKDYYSSVRMHSSRQKSTEEPYNEEGLKMHYLADGSNFVTRTGREYLDIFPVWDWLKIPGATITQKPDFPHWKEIAKKGLSDFVGGVSDGTFGTVAFDFRSVYDPLQARKAWFFFDREYLCLGSGIQSGSDYPVATTLNQCLLAGDVRVATPRAQTVLTQGQHSLRDVSWVLHDQVGYVFPAAAAITVKNTVQTGSWRDISHQARTDTGTVRKDVFTVWLDHGAKPQNASYQYIVVPGMEPAALTQYAKNLPLRVLSNEKGIQAVQHAGLQLTQIVFYEPGTLALAPGTSLTTDQPCLVMVRMAGGGISSITVSDPSQKLRSLQLKLNVPVKGTGPGWRSDWNQQTRTSVVSVDLPAGNEAGKSVVLAVSKG